jgi:hypothetical protein
MIQRICLILALLLLCSQTLMGTDSQSDTLRVRSQPHLYRNLAIGNVVFGAGAYIYFSKTWGVPNGRFHIKNEIHDNLAFNDELSHMYFGYKLTEGFDWLFRGLHVNKVKANRLGALQAALVLTLIEYPMDSYNPSQGMGLTDLAADYLGVGWALLKKNHPNSFDMKFCVKRSPWKFANKVLANTNREFDNWIWWATWKPKYVWTGVGYSTNHDQPDVEPEVYLGVGTTAYDLLHLVWPKAADATRALDSYFIGFRYRL